MIKNVIILDNHIQGLGISRICHRIGLNVHLFNHTRFCITRYSNTCKSFTLYHDETELVKLLMDFRSLDGETLIMPSNDRMVRFLEENYLLMSERFVVPFKEPDIMDICYNKIRTYKFAQSLGIPIPESYFPANYSEIEQISGIIQYPVILKPAVMHTFYKKFGKKVFKCNSKEELILNYEKALAAIPADEIIVQKFLTGGAPNLFSFGSFCDGKKVIGSFTANRLRQKPMDFGISTTFARTVLNSTIRDQAVLFLEELQYYGLSEVEFMFDGETGAYRLIEINPRTWKWHTLVNQLDLNLIGMMIDDLNNKAVYEKHAEQEGVEWIERVTDTWVVITEILKGRMNWTTVFSSSKCKREYAVFSWNDPLPSLIYILFLPVFLVTR